MAHRRISVRGVTWDVYDVVVSGSFPRVGQPQPAPPTSTQIPFVRAWLCFESETDKRRLVPIPEDWEHATEAELLELLAQATPVEKKMSSDPAMPDAQLLMTYWVRH